MHDSGEWLSHDQAAVILGCSRTTIGNLAEAGRFERRDASRCWPSLSRESVERVARERVAERRKARARVKRRAERARNEAKRSSRLPPDDEHVWFSRNVVALILGVSISRVSQFVRAERLPYTLKGYRAWFRRDHIEIVAAARAFKQEQKRAADSLRRPMTPSEHVPPT